MYPFRDDPERVCPLADPLSYLPLFSTACSGPRRRSNARRPVVVDFSTSLPPSRSSPPVSLRFSTVSLPVSQTSAYYTPLSIFSGNRRPSILFASPASLRSLIFLVLPPSLSHFLLLRISLYCRLLPVPACNHDLFAQGLPLLVFSVKRCALGFGRRLRRRRPTSQLLPSATHPPTTTDSSLARSRDAQNNTPSQTLSLSNYYSTATMAKGGGALLLARSG